MNNKMTTEYREMNSFEETLHLENMELKRKSEVEQEIIKKLIDLKNKYYDDKRNLEFENEFLKHKNRQYREEIWNHELKKA